MPQELLQEKRNESMFVIPGSSPSAEKKQIKEGSSDFIIFNDRKFAKVAKKDEIYWQYVEPIPIFTPLPINPIEISN